MAQRKETNGTWTFYGRYPKGADGTRKVINVGVQDKKEARIAEIKFIEEYKELVPSHIIVNQVIEEYNKDAPNGLKESTLKGYSRIERVIISPTFGDKYIDQITTLEIQRWINSIFNNGYNDIKHCDETIKRILLYLSRLLTYAVKHDLLIKNPCSSVNIPKDPNKKPSEKSSKDNYWEIDEFNAFLETIQDGLHYDIYEFCFYVGLRIGEFCALQWKHIDLDKGTVTVEQSLSSITSKITSPKTVNSYRTIVIPKKIIDKLKLKYSYVSQIRDFNDNWFIYKDKTYISVGTLRRWFNQDVINAGVKVITFHGLRHSHASYLLFNPILSE